MGWARLDDGWHDHPKVIAAGLEAAGLWAMCLTWANKARRTSPTPGVVPLGVLMRFAGSKAKANRLAATLSSVRLFDPETADGWPIHDFDQYLPKYDPEQAKAAGAAGGKARAAKRTAKRTASKPLSGSLSESQAVDQANPSTRASARRNPVPVPSVTANAVTAPTAETAEPPAAPDGAQALIAEWIDHCDGGRPPGRVIGQVAAEIGRMLTEGIPAADVRNGLAAWHAKGLHPAALPSVVHEVRTAAQRTRPTGNANSAENRLAKAAQIAAELRAEQAAQHPQLAPVIDLPAIGNMP